MEKLRETLKETWHFYMKTLNLVAKGSKAYYAWCLLLLAFIAIGFIYYLKQHDIGLFATNMNDQVSWGLYIANFTYLVGAAAAAVLLVIPSYIYHFKPIKEIVIFGELFAASSVIMAILFVIVDLGRPRCGRHARGVTCNKFRRLLDPTCRPCVNCLIGSI